MTDSRIRTYRPYRTDLLTSEQLALLNALRPGRMMRDTILLWAQIIACWTLIAIWPTWLLVAVAIPFIGTRFYALFIIGHDGLHRRLFRDRARNDLWNDAFVLAPIGAITRLNRINHMVHHDTLGLMHDPDRYKYIADDKLTLPGYLFGLTGLRYVVRAVRNVLSPKRESRQKAGYRLRDIALLLSWQLALIGGLTLFIGWWAFPLLWLLPVYAFTFTADIVRVFLEHSYPERDATTQDCPRLISYTSNTLERSFFAPMNMNFHAAHHLWPSIPYYNLPAADALMRRSPLAAGHLLWRSSYVKQLVLFGRLRGGIAAS